MVADVLEPQRPRILDQQAEDPAPAGQIADRPVRLGIDPGGDEALELLPAIVEDADGGVARAGDLAGDVEEPYEHRVDVELGDEPRARIDQAPEAELVKGGGDSHQVGPLDRTGNYGAIWAATLYAQPAPREPINDRGGAETRGSPATHRGNSGRTAGHSDGPRRRP